MRVIYHNWSATKQRPHPQSVAEISHHSVLSGEEVSNKRYYWTLILIFFRLTVRNGGPPEWEAGTVHTSDNRCREHKASAGRSGINYVASFNVSKISDNKLTSRWVFRVSSQTKVTKSDSVSPLPYLRPPLPLPLRLLLDSDAARPTDDDWRRSQAPVCSATSVTASHHRTSLHSPEYPITLQPPPLPPLGHIWDVMLVWRKWNIEKKNSLRYSIVYYYNCAQRYEQIFQRYFYVEWTVHSRLWYCSY